MLGWKRNKNSSNHKGVAASYWHPKEKSLSYQKYKWKPNGLTIIETRSPKR